MVKIDKPHRLSFSICQSQPKYKYYKYWDDCLCGDDDDRDKIQIGIISVDIDSFHHNDDDDDQDDNDDVDVDDDDDDDDYNDDNDDYNYRPCWESGCWQRSLRKNAKMMIGEKGIAVRRSPFENILFTQVLKRKRKFENIKRK